MRTLTDYTKKKILENTLTSSQIPENHINIDTRLFEDKLNLFSNSIALSILTHKTIIFSNVDFMNERMISLIETGKAISNAKIISENNAITFIPKKMDIHLKEINIKKGTILETINMITPIFSFYSKNKTLKITGITEYPKSLDYYNLAISPFWKIFSDIELKILKRTYLTSKEDGIIEITFRPKSYFNKTINGTNIIGRYDTPYNFIIGVIEHQRNLQKKIDYNNIHPVLIRANIYASTKKMEYIERNIKSSMKIHLNKNSIPVQVTSEYSKDDFDNISITFSVFFGIGKETEQTILGHLDILSKSITFSKINNTIEKKIINEIDEILEDISDGKKHHDILEREMFIFDILTGRENSSEFNKLIKIFNL